MAQWFVFEVGKKDHGEGWHALLIDRDVNEFLAGKGKHRTQRRWLELGEQPSRRAAWAHAEALIATRH